MLRWKPILSNIIFALNCLLIFLLIFENSILLPPWVQSIGRMHPLLLHFPIVLLLLCIVWELFARFNHSPLAKETAIGDVLLLITALTSVLSALMGLLLSKEEGYAQEVVAWHKWGGVSIAVLVYCWYLFRQPIRDKKIFLSAIACCGLILVVVTGHLGAGITHGDNFLLAPVTKDKQAPNVLFEDAIIYANMVQPILKAKCISCHNDQKAKGELVMETFAQLVKGGKSGALWDATAADLGLLLNRVHLPMDNKKHMPPTGKPQLTEAEIAIVYHWIKNGANPTAKLAALPEKDTLRSLAATIFNTIETDVYTFKPAEEKKINSLRNNYRLVPPLALGSPALGVEYFGAAQFNATGLKELLSVKEQIVSLNLNKMPVTDEALATIAQLINLRKLNLSFTNIKGSGLAALKQLKELKQLSLSGTAVNAKDLAVLSSLPKLTVLYIWNTPASASNLLAIQQQFKNTVIETGFKGDSIIVKLNSPTIENEETVLVEPVALKLKHYVKGTAIYYSTDGSEPDSIHSPMYKGDFMLDKNITLKAKAFKPGWVSSDVVEKVFYKAGVKIDSIILLQAAPDAPYTTISSSVIADAQKGDLNFRSGKWIGYRGIPMQALLYFDIPKNISSVTVSNLIDIGGFIMPPQRVEVWAGSSPDKLRLIKKLLPDQPVKEAPAYMKGYEVSFKTVTEKYLKVVVVPVNKLPAWHKGKGDKGWAFVDEVFLN